MRTTLSLVISGYPPESNYIVEIEHPPEVNPIQAIRDAAREWAHTPAGREYCESIHWDFNWGDALTEIPAAQLRRYSITVTEGPYVATAVNHDEKILVWEDDDDC